MDKTIILTKENVRIYASDLTLTAEEAMRRHETMPYPSLGLSSAIAVLGPLAVMKKYGRTVATLKGDGAFKNIIVESNTDGDVRALIGNPGIATEYDNDIEKLNTTPLAIGVGSNGTLKILNEVSNNTFGGEVKIAKGNVVTDLAWYFDQSEQIQSAVLSDVRLESKTKLKRAWGVIFQTMPGYTESDIQWIEDVVKNKKLSNFSDLKSWTESLGANKLEEIELRFKCKCSKEKIRGILNTLTQQEKEDIVKEQGKLEIVCNFCGKKYDFTDEV